MEIKESFGDIVIQEKCPGDWRSFLTWNDYGDRMTYRLRGYGDTPGKAADDAWRRYQEGLKEDFEYTEIDSAVPFPQA